MDKSTKRAMATKKESQIRVEETPRMEAAKGNDSKSRVLEPGSVFKSSH